MRFDAHENYFDKTDLSDKTHIICGNSVTTLLQLPLGERMFRPVRFVALAIALLSSLASGFAPPASAQQGPADATKLVFYNASNTDVTVLVTVPGQCAVPIACAQQDGCPTGSLKTLNYINLTTGGRPTPFNQFSAATKGWFLLPRGQRIQVLNVGTNQYTGLPSACLQGLNFGFGAFSATCPDSTAVTPITSVTNWNQVPITTPGPTFNSATRIPLPNGTTGFEATINLPGTVKGSSYIQNPGCAYGPGPTYLPQNCTAGSTVACTPTACPPYVSLGSAQEAIDITCVNGANCTLGVQVTPPSTGPFWVFSGTTVLNKSTVSFQNSWVDVKNKCDNNCVDPRTGLARPGVFPYGCTQCNIFNDPKSPCTGAGTPGPNSQFCAAKNNLAPNSGCLLVRNPMVAGSQKFGGTIQVTYMGPLTPPGTCPPGSKQ